MEMYLLRHGQSLWQTKETQDKNSALSLLGVLQARTLARYLMESSDINIQSAYIRSSSQTRALQTVDELGRDYKLDERLCEAVFPISEQLPSFCKPGLYVQSFAPDERYLKFKTSLKELLDELCEHYSTKTVLLYTHGGVIKTILRLLHDNDGLCYTIKNCSLTHLSWFRSRWHIKKLNDTSFLPPTQIS